MKKTAILGLIVSAYVCAISEVSAATWVQFDKYFWIDRDSISKRASLTFYRIGHARPDGDGNWTLPPPPDESRGNELAIDCSTRLKWANSPIYPSGMTDDDFIDMTQEEEDMLPHQWQPQGKPLDPSDRLVEVVCGAK